MTWAAIAAAVCLLHEAGLFATQEGTSGDAIHFAPAEGGAEMSQRASARAVVLRKHHFEMTLEYHGVLRQEQGANEGNTQVGVSREKIAGRAADQFAEIILDLHPEKSGPEQPEKWQAFNAKHKQIRRLGPEIIPHLCRLAGHRNPRVRRWSLDAIPWVEKGSESAVQTLIGALSDPDPLVRFEAAEGLGRIERSATHDYRRLFEALHDEDQNVRTAAAQSLAALSPAPAELPKLIAATDNADPVVRRLAADALGLAGRTGEPALRALEAMAGDPNVDVRSAAFRAVRRIKGAPIPPWRWDAESSSPLHCMACYNGPYDLEVVKAQSQELLLRVRKDGGILHEWPVHALGTPFLLDGDVLYCPRLRTFATGCILTAFDLKRGKKLWETDLEAMGSIGHSKYFNNGINLSLNEGILRVDGSEMAGTYTEIVDASTGKTLANYRCTGRWAHGRAKPTTLPSRLVYYQFSGASYGAGFYLTGLSAFELDLENQRLRKLRRRARRPQPMLPHEEKEIVALLQQEKWEPLTEERFAPIKSAVLAWLWTRPPKVYNRAQGLGTEDGYAESIITFFGDKKHVTEFNPRMAFRPDDPLRPPPESDALIEAVMPEPRGIQPAIPQ